MGRVYVTGGRNRWDSAESLPVARRLLREVVMSADKSFTGLDATGLQEQIAKSFSWPHQVALDPGLGMGEKRAILSAWASDANTVDSMPALRHMPGTPLPVTHSSIMDARLLLDRVALQSCDAAAMRSGSRRQDASRAA
jgi:hypothetical protein